MSGGERCVGIVIRAQWHNGAEAARKMQRVAANFLGADKSDRPDR